ncbi:MAG: hypothetical protein PHQ27_06595, partial [Victivallales bacterium]|nr:hypothetical protein [Victivallales bacterium]
MKIRQLLLSLLMFGTMSGVAAFAAETQSQTRPATAPRESDLEQRADDDWTFFQIGFWFDVPSYTKNSNVYGIKTGQPVSSGAGKVYGVEGSWIAAATDHINGIQGSWVSCFNRDANGLQASLVFCRNTDYLRGVQASFVCLS